MPLAKDATILHIPRDVRHKLKLLAAQQEKPMYVVLEELLDAQTLNHQKTQTPVASDEVSHAQ